MPRSTDRARVTSRTSAEALGAAAIAGAALQRGGSVVDAADAVQRNFPRLDRNTAYEIGRTVRGYGQTNTIGRFEAGTAALPANLYEPVPGLLPPARYLIRFTSVDPLTGEERYVHHWIEGPVGMTMQELVEQASAAEAIIIQRGFRYPEEEEAPEIPESPPVPSLILAQRRT
jgi:hypothetical protein